jgi:isoleucyl-tRNA synthetase
MDYKDTLQLPQTAFPMKGDLPKREPSWQAHWEKNDIYNAHLKQRADAPEFNLHDGPPFANGDAHMGHALNMSLKDFVLKSKAMSGFRVPFVPGWDCHGLPIEHKVNKEINEQQKGGAAALGPVEIRERCEAYARKYIDLQRGQFMRLGVFGEWFKPYVTMEPAYEADILRVFAGMVEKGLVYQALRPVHWSTGCLTALAEAEIEYADRQDSAIFVAFPLTPEAHVTLGLEGAVPASFVIWTTTPWTLPANLAIAAHADLVYVIAQSEGRTFIFAESRLEAIAQATGKTFTVLAKKKGSELLGLTYKHAFLDRTGPLLNGEFVTADSGSGLVHIAPGHGPDDYQLGMKNGLPILSPVNEYGKLTEECGVPALVGMYVFKANAPIIELLAAQGDLLAREDFSHSYPHCWRSGTPIIFRSVTQWFIKVDAFRQAALDEIEKVDWVPAWGKNRIRGAVEGRPDWCISRQRTWGVPIPAFYQEDGTAILDAKVICKFADIVEKEGTNVWFGTPDADLAARLGVKDAARKGLDTLDVWIDSGSSHAAVTRRRLKFPADLYLEGSDQHRGWFQSSLLTSVAVTGEAPYKQVLTNGFVVDLDGKKLSKSAGGYQKPANLTALVDKYGADILRMWVASQDYRDDIPFSDEIFKRVADTYRTVRNTLRILLANLEGFDAKKDGIADAQLDELDRHVLVKLQDLVSQVRAAYDRYEFHQVYHLLNRFCAVDLSAFYVDVLKDRMYCDPKDSARRRSSQTVIHQVLETVALLAAPVMPFTSEEAWQFAAGYKEGDTTLARESVHLQKFPEARVIAIADGFTARWEKILEWRTKANEQLEGLRRDKTIGKSLEAEAGFETNDFTQADAELLAEVCIVSKVRIKAGQGNTLTVAKSDGQRCSRCWRYYDALGLDPAHPELCERCTKAVTAS